MENKDIQGVLNSLTSRGVLSADGRRQVFAILTQQAKEHETDKSLLEADVERLRKQKAALLVKNAELLSLVPKSKLAQLS